MNNKQAFHPNRTEARSMLFAGTAVAALYALCFSGVEIRPQLSFTVFCPAVLLLWSAVLHTMGRLKNRRAFIWAVPILICAAFNGIFHANPFTWGNALLVHGLFAAFTLTALREQPTDLFQLSGLLALLRVVLGNWIAFIDVIRAALSERIVGGIVTGKGVSDGRVAGGDVSEGRVAGGDVSERCVVGGDASEGSVVGGDVSEGRVFGVDISERRVTDAQAASESVTCESTANGQAFVKIAVNKNRRAAKILLGLLLALPFMIVITALLMSADAVFGRLASDMFDTIFGADWFNMSSIVTFMIVWIYALGYPCLAITRSRDVYPINIPLPRADTTVCATFLLSVNAVFALFTFVQFAFLFNGGFMQLPADMVYSQYAREGFFQLLFVTVINFAVIIVFMTMLRNVVNNRILRGLLSALCFFTGVLIISSFYRMGLYTGAYGHTTLRLCVYTFLAMEVVLLGVTAWKLFDARVAFIRLYVLVGLVFYLIVNISGSDYVAAKLNAGMFLSGQLSQVDLFPVGPDGLRALQPLIEDEANICVGYMLTSKEYAQTLAKNEPEWEQNYNSLKARVLNSPTDATPWQNWSYLKR